MVTLRCKESGYEVTGKHEQTTTDHFVLEMENASGNGKHIEMFRIDEWEVVKNETMGSIEGTR